jgi:photosystem II stability/assembly factor-like uncharacterized protein
MLAAVLWPANAWAVATTSLRAVNFSDAMHGYIVGGFAIPPNLGVSYGVMSWTDNGGTSWHAKTETNRFMAGVCASVDGGTAVPSGADMLYKSSDSGVSWAEETPLLGRSVALSDMAYLAGGRRVVVGKLASSNDIALIASSVNNAAWNIDYEGPSHPAPSPDVDPPTTYAEFSAIDAVAGGNVAWAVGQDRTFSTQTPPWTALIRKTIDAGSTWTTQTAAASTSGLKCVAAVDDQIAFIGEDAKFITRTTDGGTTWTRLAAAVTGPVKVKAIDAIDADHVLIVGDGGKIAWTANASASTPVWSVNSTATTNALLGAQMLDATHWIVVGDNETILRTSDAGATWTGSGAPVAPSVSITSPASSGNVLIEGTSTDGSGIGVAKVEVRIQQANGQYWNGTNGWVASADTWLPVAQSVAAEGWDHWSRTTSLPPTTGLTISARATDGVGLTSPVVSVTSLLASKLVPYKSSQTIAYGTSATIAGTLKSGAGAPLAGSVTLKAGSYTRTVSVVGGVFSFSVTPNVKTAYTLSFAGANGYSASSAQVTVLPYAKVTTPVLSTSYVRHTRYFRTYSYLYPKHTGAASTMMTFTFQHYEKVHGAYRYVTKKTVLATSVTNYSTKNRPSVSMKLWAGKWRVQAKHVDSGHATTYSARKYFTVH